MSLVKQLENYLFPKNFGNKSIINIVLDYREDYRPVFDQVLYGLKKDIVLVDHNNILCNKNEQKYFAYSTNYSISQIVHVHNGFCNVRKNRLLFVQQKLVTIQIDNQLDKLLKMDEEESYNIVLKIISRYEKKN